jgi:hypothetical protein
MRLGQILIDTCVGCGKSLPNAPDWHQRTDASWQQRLAAAGLRWATPKGMWSSSEVGRTARCHVR